MRDAVDEWLGYVSTRACDNRALLGNSNLDCQGLTVFRGDVHALFSGYIPTHAFKAMLGGISVCADFSDHSTKI
jgi:hypothetical protein